MLGKLIKNEFVQRGKSVLGLLGCVTGLAVLTAIFDIFVNDMGIDNGFFNTLYSVIAVTFVLSMYTSMIGIVVLSISDYGKRLFKEQAYLTHTLPVKTISILLARMVCDICLCIGMGIVYPLAMCIAVKDFSIFGDIARFISKLVQSDNVGRILADLGLGFITALFFVLFSMWMYYSAYAIGHSASNHRRAYSVLTFILMYIIITFVSGLVGYIFNFYYLSSTQAIIVVDIFLALGTALFVAITNYVCARKLNLE